MLNYHSNPHIKSTTIAIPIIIESYHHSLILHCYFLPSAGILTTPQLHYMVRCINTGGAYGDPTEDGYYHKLSSAFHSMVPEVQCTLYYIHTMLMIVD